MVKDRFRKGFYLKSQQNQNQAGFEYGNAGKAYQDAHYQIHIHKKNLPAGSFRIVFLTDLHNRANEEETEALLALIDQNQPDLVLCGGDMIVSVPGESVEPAVRFMTRLSSLYTVYVGTGNHEYRAELYKKKYGSMYEDYRQALRDCDIVFLKNEKAEIDVKGLPVQIFGFDMRREYYRRPSLKTLPPVEIREAIGVPDREQISILLAHNPLGIKAYMRWGADLTLCGHYHGGLVRLGKHHGLISPDFRPFPGNAYGLFQENGSSVIVSSGCGEHTFPLRINNPREIVTADVFVNL